MYTICMVGTGYVGLVTGACLADFGNRVICVDVDAQRIETLTAGRVPFFEPLLEDLVQRNHQAGRLDFTTDSLRTVRESDVIFIAVGTPDRGDGSADLSYLFKVVEDIAPHLSGYKVLVNKSTVPVGTGRKVQQMLRDLLPAGTTVDVASNPEFLREGSAIEDFMRPNRVVIGAETDRARQIMRDIYRPLYLLETPIVVTNIETAELIKYASNAFLATKISFINEMAGLCDAVGGDVRVVARAMGLDRRIGDKFLHAGPGYGGSCFPKDTRALLHFATAAGVELPIVRATHETNERQIERMVEKCGEAMGGLAGKTVAMLGLSFKPNTDDVREAPALRIAKRLLAAGAQVKAFDPVAMPNAAKALPGLKMGGNANEVCASADALVIVTEWNEFRRLDLERIRGLLRNPVLIDMRNIYSPAEAATAGLRYVGVGRAAAADTPAAKTAG